MMEIFTDANPMRLGDYKLPADGWQANNSCAPIAQEVKMGTEGPTTIKDLIATLKTKDQDAHVEFVVIGADGQVVTIHLADKIQGIVDMLTVMSPKASGGQDGY